jgi:hypothetical protein
MDGDGGLQHILTYHHDPNSISNDESFNLTKKDGLFLIDVGTITNCTLKLEFTFYTLAHNSYVSKDRPYDPISNAPASIVYEYQQPTENLYYIEIGKKSELVRPHV